MYTQAVAAISKRLTLALLLVLTFSASATFAQTTAFTYQGKLTDSGNPANGSYDLQFKLFDALSGGSQQGTTQTASNVTVTNGIFTVQLDFGVCAGCFNGAARFLEIAVRPTGSGSFITLSPRQPVTSTPYAIKTTNLTFNGAYNDGTIIFNASNTFTGEGAGVSTAPSGTLNDATGKFNSYYGAGAGQQNTTGNFNAFFGAQAGQQNTTGNFNAFFGQRTGFSNTTGHDNSFFGQGTGFSNTTGFYNTFFGSLTGQANTTGNSNAFFGTAAGQQNTTAGNNAFFGAAAGQVNTTGTGNAFFGSSTGGSNTIGSLNAFFGYQAGFFNTSGGNAFFGALAGASNTSGSFNTFIGRGADFNGSNPTTIYNTLLGAFATVTSGVSNGTAIGANASVTQSNSLILGSINGVNGASADTNVGIGTTAPQGRLNVNGTSWFQGDSTPLAAAAGKGLAVGFSPPNGNGYIFAFDYATFQPQTLALNSPGGNVGIGTSAPNTKLEVVDPFRQLRFGPTTADNGGYLISTVPHQAIITGGAKFDGTNWIARDTVASLTANQFGAVEFYTNSGLTVGSPFSPSLRMRIDENGKVSIGTTSPTAKLHVDGGNGTGVRGASTNDIGVYGSSVNSIGVYGATSNSASYAGLFDGRVIATSYSVFSDARLKQDISKLGYGLSEVLRLRPVSWRWKAHPESGGQLGLVAQEVEPVLPELVSTSTDAEQMKGLNYTGLIPVLVNAIQQQQQQLDQQQAQDRRQQTLLAAQQTQIKQQQAEIAALQQQLRQIKQTDIRQQQQEMAAIKRLLCASRPRAAICKAKALK